MRELSFQVKDGLKVGLRPDSRQQRTPGYMSTVTNWIASEFGFYAPTPINNPFTGETVAWPFPQFLRGKGVSLLGGSTSIKSVNESTFVGTALTTYNPLTDAVKAIPAGGPWQMVDFYDSWVLLNGSCAVYKLNTLGMQGQTNKVYVQDSGSPVCGCEFKSRAIFGGFSLTNYQPQWDAIADQQKFVYTPSTRGNVVFWTTIGGGDLEWSLVASKIPDDWLSYLKQGTSGFMPMPFQGTVFHVKQLGDNLIAYGADGVAIMTPMIEPQPGFGVRPLGNIGVASRGAVGGDERKHLFIDPSGVLWEASGGDIKRLGYQEYLADLLGSHIIISYNKEDEEFYISNGIKAFVYKDGLTAVEVMTTGTHFIQGGQVGLKLGTQGKSVMTTHTFDMGVRSIKHIGVVEVAHTGLSDVEVMVKSSFNSDSVAANRWVPCNSLGVAYPTQSGVDFQVSVRGTATDLAKIDLVTVRWKNNDNRAVRGYYQNAPT